MKLRLLIIAIILFSCKQNPNKDVVALWNEITILHNNNDFDDTLILLNRLIDDYSNSSYIPDAYYLISEIYINEHKEYSISIDYLLKLLDSYPDHNLAKKSLFTLGYINANYIDSYTDATTYYNLFLTKYPDDDLIPSVKYELKGLEKINDKINSLLRN